MSRQVAVTLLIAVASFGLVLLSADLAKSQPTPGILYKPYIQPGDAGGFGLKDQMLVVWQTAEALPHPNAYRVEFGSNKLHRQTVVPRGRVVDNYLTADRILPIPSTAPGTQVNYYALLNNLDYNTEYFYRVTGPGLPTDGFPSSFRTRKRNAPFSFEVVGDEGFFPPDPANKPYLANFVARIVHEMYNVQNFSFPNQKPLPKPDLALNTGDNVYNKGSEGNYRDYWMPIWNSDIDSNETGAPFVRSIPCYIAAGNHDFGGDGDRVNLLGDEEAGRFSGNIDGGDALQYFNNYYFPLNGPLGFDPQYIFNGDQSSANGFYFRYRETIYNSPAAIAAFRASTTVDTGQGMKRQIDHMSNYSFDYGNAHFIFLDANPHLFNAIVSNTPVYQNPPSDFPDYPSILRDWLMNDLDGSNQTWKIVVFHQPPFSSGNSTLRNHQMRRIVKLLEDHGVNLVYNGHEHNYQRTLPLRALPRVAQTPTTIRKPAVALDMTFDGKNQTVPDGVIYIVEGAGGDRDFDNNLLEPRGRGSTLDQDDSASGVFSYAKNLFFPKGPDSWLDTNLTNIQMLPFFPNAGAGAKITARFKSKVFSFGDVVVDGNSLTHYQISEPLQAISSGKPGHRYPYGTDMNGKQLKDPIPATLINPITGIVVTRPSVGTPALLDKFTITKPNIARQLVVQLFAPPVVSTNNLLTYRVRVTNNSAYALNGTQVVVTLPSGMTFADKLSYRVTKHSQDVVLTIGRLERGTQRNLQLKARVAANLPSGTKSNTKAVVRSSTAQSVSANVTFTNRG
ncbi:MAG: metallophosphoesterase [Chroococcidiopsidaceae cyanobacterium CP_BM_RX_35]|nr:metallophosphoesterase [Chroococcidiopsidaceae cyanobacterium CP_BM_RX_35]